MLSELMEVTIRMKTWDSKTEHQVKCNLCGTVFYSPLELIMMPYGAYHTKKTKPCPVCGHRER